MIRLLGSPKCLCDGLTRHVCVHLEGLELFSSLLPGMFHAGAVSVQEVTLKDLEEQGKPEPAEVRAQHL